MTGARIDSLDVAVVTSRNLAHFGTDDRILVDALVRAGFSARAIPWVDEIDWSSVKVAVVRSSWDYWDDVEAFLRWVDHVSGCSTLFNPPEVIRWNADKRYLTDLARRGFPVVPTRWVSRGTGVTLSAVLSEEGWERAVIKPVVSGAAENTFLVDAAEPGAHAGQFERLLAARDMMVQPFMAPIETEGELSLIFINGAYTHTMVKRPNRGDYRVQEEHGGSLERVEPGAEVVDLARRIVESVASGLPYARVDLVSDGAGGYLLMELELIEPELFLRYEPRSVDALVEVIAAAVGP